MTQQEHIDALKAAHAALELAHEAFLTALQAYAAAVRAASAEGIRAPGIRPREALEIPPLVITRTATTELFRAASRTR